MADPKFANLPGIAPPDEKDVYETDDLPEVDQDLPLTEADSEFIDRPHLDPSAAHARFRGKGIVPSPGMDFSDAARLERRMGYLAVSGDWEIAAQGEPETIIQRRNRLQAEFRLLIDEINAGKDSKEAVESSLVPELESSLRELSQLQLPEGSTTPSAVHYIKNIQKVIKDLSEKKATKKAAGKSSEPVLVLELNSYPAHDQFSKSSRIADLELRLRELQNVVGSTPDTLNRLQMSELKSVGHAVNELTSRVNLLDLNSIDAIDRKLAGVLSKMDGIVEKRGGEKQVELETKVNELYNSYKRVEALCHSLLPIADRLMALSALNEEAADFKRIIDQLKSEVKTANNKIALDEALAASLREEMVEVSKNVATNIDAFNKRLDSLKK